ncbi:MAG TPA: class I SAM-dependent methyltransferase [Candidatus Paceibacterota bacterium]|nr:class I SAM-dependent methyltransferase [Candidatus Paceibacterota bacterium]
MITLFRKWSLFYDSKIVRLLYFDRVQPYIVKELSLVLKNLQGKSLRCIDVACGTGEILCRLAGEFPDVSFVGVDLSDDMIDVARAKCGAMPNIQFVSANAIRLPFEDNFFDLSICTDAIHHFSVPEKILAELYRITNRTGWVFVADPAYDTLFQRIIVGTFGITLDKPIRYYPKKDLRAMIAGAGFSPISPGYKYFTNVFLAQKR